MEILIAALATYGFLSLFAVIIRFIISRKEIK